MIRLLYVTAKDVPQAKAIGRTLVEERLAACVNILPQMHAIYPWNGAIETADEAVLIVKTTDILTDRATARIKELHSYDVPCVLSLQVLKGNPGYLSWLYENTAPLPPQAP